MTDIYGYDTTSTFIDGINANNLSSLDNTCDIELNNDTINLNAENVLISGQSLTNDLNQLEQKTLYIQLPISNEGTVFSNNVYAEKFIVPLGTNKQYLMADGSLLEESSNQQSNIYLYSFNQTLTPPPANGQVRWNATSSATTTEIYISHITRDNIDIDVFLSLINLTSIIYIQDQNDSTNYVRFDVTSAITINVNFVSVPVAFLNGGGDGLARFNAGHNITLSIFTNNLEVDQRISALESKTQHQSATSTATLIESDLNINTNTQFNINDSSGLLNWLHLDNGGMILTKNITAPKFITTGGLTTQFVKANGDLDSTVYATTASIADKLNKTGDTMSGDLAMGNNNINGVNELYATSVVGGEIITGTIYDQSYTNSINLTPTYIVLNAPRVDLFGPIDMFNHSITNISAASIQGAGDVFEVKNSSSADLFKINQTAIQCSAPINMNSNKITALAEPTNATDVATKNYVDIANNLKLNLSGGTVAGTLNVAGNLNPRLGTNDLFNVTASDGITGRFRVFNNGATFYIPMSMNQNILNGIPTPVSNDDATNKLYVDTADNLKLNLSGGTMTGSLNMGSNQILNAGGVSTSNLTLSGSTASGQPYFNGNQLQTANRDFFIVSGVQTIQSLVNTAVTGTVIKLSSSAWTESVVCSGQNYTIAGAPCANFNQMTTITGNFSIGAVSPTSIQTRVRLKDLKIVGNLTFNGNATHQELRTYIDNCDIAGSITFTTSVNTASGGGQIFFYNCSFSGVANPLFTIANSASVTYYFTNCSFGGQPIVNNLSAGNFNKLIFTNCSIMATLSLGNCVLNGLNASTTVSSLTASSITLGGASSSFVKGNGSLDAASYTTIVNVTPFSMTFLSQTVSGFKARYITDGTNKIVTITCPSGAVFTNTAGASNGFSATGFPIPAEIIPSTSITSFIRVASGATNLPLCYCVVASNGGFTFGSPDLSPSFIAGGVVGWQGNTTITYST